MLQLLGTVARHFPSALGPSEDPLFRLAVRLAEAELGRSRGRPELPVAAGALVCVRLALFSFPETGGEGVCVSLCARGRRTDC
jgi:hypothetical protein